MQTLRTDKNVILCYETCGPASAPHIILVSGAGAPAAFWNNAFVTHLVACNFQVTRYCHRDTGLSTHFNEPYALFELLADLRALINEVSSNTVHLVGHSMGGYLVQYAICEFPELLASATSISAGPTVSHDLSATLKLSSVKDEVWAKLIENLPTGNYEKDLPGWLDSWAFLNGDRAFDRNLAETYTEALYVGDKRNAKVAVNHVHAMTTVPDTLVADLQKSQTQLLVLHGSQDPLVPIDHGKASAALAANSVFQKIEGAGHMFFNMATWHEIANCLKTHCRQPQ